MQKTLTIFAALILWIIFWSQSAYAFQKNTVTITPDIAVAFVGDTIQFAADVLDSSGNAIDTTLNWEFTTNSVGSIDSLGLFIAEEEGLGFLRAFIGDGSDIATVIVQDSSLDSTGIQTIKIIRAKKNPKAPADTLLLEEGSYYKLTSFQFPLNVVNGGILHFPTGSLSENIKIELKTSSFAVESGDSLIFPDSIINTIDFRVFIDDNLRTPYFFRKPVKIAIPFKRGLLEKLGISPFDIGMFFFNDSTGFDTSGVTNIAVDTVANRIFADINRFENIVLAKRVQQEIVSVDSTDTTDIHFVVARLDFQTYDILGFYEFSQSYDPVNIDDPNYDFTGNMYYYHQSPIDFGFTTIISSTSGDTIYHATSTWAGLGGKVLFPYDSLYTTDYGIGYTSAPPEADNFISFFGEDETRGDSAWSVIKETDFIRRLDLKGGYGVLIIDQGFLQGVADTSHNEWIVIAYSYELVTGVEDEISVMPNRFSLNQNYPNPFNPVTNIKYTLSGDSKVSLIIYNILGQEVARLVNSTQSAGTHIVSWDASKVASSGIYFYRLQASPTSVWRAGDFVLTRKMVLLK